MGDQVGQTENGSVQAGKSQPEDLSKEELLQQLKKQRMLLQKIKQKCDELSQKNALLENDLAKERECFVSDDSSQEKLGELEKKCVALQEQNDSFQDENLRINRQNQELVEQLECMRMKEETLNSAMVCIQEELNKLSIENKGLKNEVKSLEVEQQKALSLTSANVELTQALEETEHKYEQLREEQLSLKESLKKEAAEHDRIMNMLEKEKEKILDLQQENTELISNQSVLQIEITGKTKLIEDLTENAETLAQKIHSVEVIKSEQEHKVEVSMAHIGRLEALLQEKDIENKRYLTELQELEELRKDKDQLQKLLDEVEISTKRASAEELYEKASECEHLQQVLEQTEREKNELEIKYQQLMIEKNEFEEVKSNLQRKVGESADRVASLIALQEESTVEKQSFLEELENLEEVRSERDQLRQLLEEERKQSCHNDSTEALDAAGCEIDKLKQHIELLEADLEYTKVERDRLMFEENREDYDTAKLNPEMQMTVCEVDRLKKRIELLEAELANTREERDRLMFQEEKDDLDTASLQSQLQILEAELEDVKSKLESSEFEAEELKANLEYAQQELVKLRTIVPCGDKTHISSPDIGEELVSHCAEMHDTAPLLCNEINVKDFESIETIPVTTSSPAENKNLLDENVHRLEKLESDKLILESKLTSINELETRLKCIVKEMLVCINEQDSSFTVTEEDHIFVWLQCLKAQLFILTENYATVSKQLNEKDAEISSVKSELGDTLKLLSERNETILGLKSSMQATQEAVNNDKEETDDLVEELNKLKCIHSEREKQYNEKEAELQQLKFDLVNREKEVAECRAEINEQALNMKVLADENAALKEELVCLNGQLEESVSRHHNLQVKISEYESAVEILQAAIAEKENHLYKMSENLEEKSHELQSVSSELENLKSIQSSLQEQVLELEVVRSRLGQTEAHCEQLENEKEILHNQLILQQEQNGQVRECYDKSVETDGAVNIDGVMQICDDQAVEIAQMQNSSALEKEEYALELRKKEDIEKDLLHDNECLKAEVISLQESLEGLRQTVDISRQDFSKLELALEESTERVQKYKAVAMKAKKELLEAKQQISEMEGSLKQLECDKELATKQVDTHKESLQEVEDRCSRLQNDLDKALFDMATVRSQLADLQADKDNMQSELNRIALERKQLEHVRDDLKSQVTLITEGRTKAEAANDKLSSEVRQLHEQLKVVESQLSKEAEAHQSKSIQLDKLHQEMKQRNLMNLEIEDYERLVGELNQQVAELGSEKEKLQDEVKKQKEMAVGLRTQLEQAEAQHQQAEERGNKLKALLVKTKKDLNEGKRKEAEHQSAQTKNQIALEMCKQDCERLKVEYADILGENQKAHESMRLMKESHQRIVRALEVQVASLQEDINTLRHEYEACQMEYEGYKVRVHSVLKQQKSKVKTPSTGYKAPHDLESLEKTIEHLKNKLEEANEQLSTSLSENQILQDEHDRLLQRHNKLLQEIESKETAWKIKFTSLVTEGNAQEDEHEETIQQLQRQNETVTATFKEQLRTMKAEHERQVEGLRLQLAVADAELCRLQQDQQKMSPTRDDDLFDVTITERQEGEGSENTEPPVSSTPNKLHDDYPPSSTTVSLEQLLNTDDKTSIASSVPNDMEGVDAQLGIAAKRIDHLSELLNESEASNIRLTEQTRVLKEEIRRLERNQQREQHVSNLEYLKNVVIKFLTLQAGDERERLIPVLTMLLQLSPQERTELGIIAKGASAEGSDSSSSGWENYLPRWSGLV